MEGTNVTRYPYYAVIYLGTYMSFEVHCGSLFGKIWKDFGGFSVRAEVLGEVGLVVVVVWDITTL